MRKALYTPTVIEIYLGFIVFVEPKRPTILEGVFDLHSGRHVLLLFVVLETPKSTTIQ